MNQDQLSRMHEGRGFIAALDQSGGSTPGALEAYGIGKDRYNSDAQMFDLMHEMRARIISSPVFTSEQILAVILFADTMGRSIKRRPSAEYLWEEQGIVPFLKVDAGLAEEADGVQLMKDMPELDSLLARAAEQPVFGTKMRSLIKSADTSGIEAIADQQFAVAGRIMAAGLVPILEPEVDIHAPDKEECETLLLAALTSRLAGLPDEVRLMLKLSLPTHDGLYAGLLDDPRVVRVVALSGGYSRDEACSVLRRNHGVIASFSRALTEGLSDDLSAADFDAQLRSSIEEIYAASVS